MGAPPTPRSPPAFSAVHHAPPSAPLAPLPSRWQERAGALALEHFAARESPQADEAKGPGAATLSATRDRRTQQRPAGEVPPLGRPRLPLARYRSSLFSFRLLHVRLPERFELLTTAKIN